MLKQIYNFERYAISDEGFIINIETGRILKPDLFTTTKGRRVVYLRVTLSRDNVQYRFAVHRLVADHFIDNPENKQEVNHKDGDRYNNHKDNLEWVTCEENSVHATETGLRPKGENHGNALYSEEQALLVIKLSKEGLSRKEVSIQAGTTISFVKDIRCGKAWKHIPR